MATAADPATLLEPFRATLHWPPVDADRLILSFPKAGRTWLRVMTAAAAGIAAGVEAEAEVARWLESDVVRAHGRTLCFTHGLANRLDADRSHVEAFAARWSGLPALVLVRDPRDTIVSYYFQRTRRRGLKPDSPIPADLAGFIRDEMVGVTRILDLMNIWERVARSGATLRLSYESLHRDPTAALRRSLAFLLGLEVSDEVLARAVRFGRFEHMRELELSGRFAKGKRLWTPDKADPDSYKTRSGQIGGFTGHLDADALAFVDRLIAERLDPGLGYRRAGQAPPDRWPG